MVFTFLYLIFAAIYAAAMFISDAIGYAIGYTKRFFRTRKHPVITFTICLTVLALIISGLCTLNKILLM